MTITNLTAELDLLEREIETGASKFDTGFSLSMTITAILQRIAAITDIALLDEKLTSSERFDVSELRALAGYLRGVSIDEARFEAHDGDNVISAREELAKLTEHLEVFDTVQEEHGRREASLRLGWLLDSNLQRLVLCILDRDEVTGEIARRLFEQLRKATDQEIIDLWGNILAEFQETRIGPSLARDFTILPQDFFEVASLNVQRERIANYIAFLKAKLIAKSEATGTTRYPAGTPGIASILASREIRQVDPDDRRLAMCMSRLAALLTEEERAEMASTLNVMTKGWICRHQLQKEQYRRSIGSESAPTAEQVNRLKILLLRRLLVYVESYTNYQTPISRALLQYHLGLEVMLPDSRKAVLKNNELGLQKELCRFLLERGVFAVGTKFGRSEIDLLVHEGPINFVVETKVYKAVSHSKIRKDLAQLQTYLGQQPVASRGILLIYNISDTLITTEPRWFDGRYWIVPINLLESPASKTTKGIHIKPGAGSELVDFVSNTATAPGKEIASKARGVPKRKTGKNTAKKNVSRN